MKRGFRSWFLFLFLLLSSFPVFSAFESVSLRVGESKQIEDVNFTLLRTSVDDDKIVICINNRKVIVSDRADIGNSIVRVNDVFSMAANLEIEVVCKGSCKCGSDCSNEECFVSASSASCKDDTECDDNNPNTVDLCVSGVCENRPVQLKVCSSDAECNDNNPCTTDQCNKVLKKCIHTEIENCSVQPEQPPEQQEPQTSPKPISLAKLSAFILLGVVVILLAALVIKRVIR